MKFVDVRDEVRHLGDDAAGRVARDRTRHPPRRSSLAVVLIPITQHASRHIAMAVDIIKDGAKDGAPSGRCR
ncbi:hypothetical protein [Dactylosporangium sp. NPDC000521]|uniref:hypothetical protein n=1 Tax=Dactylosporangium sp. NPDC000521 TaxID=3363975 RepID=UPI003676CAFA